MSEAPDRGKTLEELHTLIQQFTARVARLERELRDVRAQLEARQLAPRARTGTS
jgi:outer membrane murein-binding lipoprotein Lpp